MNEAILVLPWALFALLTPLVLRASPRIDSYAPPPGARWGASDDDARRLPLVSIIVPARNEAMNIGTCVASLLDSAYPNYEIIVVDDQSRDGTGDISRALAERARDRVRVIEGAPLPDGWIGKPWACWQGYRAARGDLLLFTDADTRHDSDLLGRTVAALDAEHADLVSVLPRQRMEGFWERMVMPHVGLIIQLRYPRLGRVNRSRDPRGVFANGQFILMRRDTYEAIGGHEAVRHEVVEDLRLAQRLVERGKRLFIAHAEAWMETRMYRSLRGLVEGWSKNLAEGARYTVAPGLRPMIPWLLAGSVFGFWTVPVAALLVAAIAGWAGALGWAAGATACSLAFWTVLCVRSRVPALNALLYPVGAVMTAWLFVRSARRERVVWRGRAYESRR